MIDPKDRSDALAARTRARWAIGAALVAVALLVWGIGAVFGGGSGGGERKREKPDAACDAAVPDAPSPQSYDEPRRVLEAGIDYGAIIHTSCGEIALDLLEEQAPENVNSFMFLAGEGFYDGLQFYRVERNSVIETGDPNDRVLEPPDGAGFAVPDELPGEPRDYVFGVVGMANVGLPDTGSSRFFIVVHENRPAGYQLAYSIFGVVDESSYEVLREIAKQPVEEGDEPIEAVRPSIPIYVESVEIIEI